MNYRRRLIATRSAQLTFERKEKIDGEHGAFLGVVGRLLDGGLQIDLREATEWVDKALAVMRTAPDADPAWTDEDIAKMIVEKLFPHEVEKA
jgi:hypothetical protein